MLVLQQLEKRYPTGDLALKGVSLSVGSGEILGLIGPSSVDGWAGEIKRGCMSVLPWGSEKRVPVSCRSSLKGFLAWYCILLCMGRNGFRLCLIGCLLCMMLANCDLHPWLWPRLVLCCFVVQHGPQQPVAGLVAYVVTFFTTLSVLWFPFLQLRGAQTHFQLPG
jgi:ABC-type multidrug transport system fused ATPase/permease subunit